MVMPWDLSFSEDDTNHINLMMIEFAEKLGIWKSKQPL